MTPPWWTSLDDVRSAHSFFEVSGLVLFAFLVVFEFLEHLKTKREHLFQILGIISFALAILSEILAYPYSQRNDELSGNEIRLLGKISNQARLDAAAAVGSAKDAATVSDAARAKADKAVTTAGNAEALARGARIEADSFEKDIVSAKKQATEAEAHLAEALRRAENAESHAAQVANKVADRTLSPLQQANIPNRLRQFGARRIDVIIIGDTAEIGKITGLIDSAMQQAGWTVHVVGKAVSGPNVSGVLVGTHIGSGQGVADAADALISALLSEGIASF